MFVGHHAAQSPDGAVRNVDRVGLDNGLSVVRQHPQCGRSTRILRGLRERLNQMHQTERSRFLAVPPRAALYLIARLQSPRVDHTLQRAGVLADMLSDVVIRRRPPRNRRRGGRAF